MNVMAAVDSFESFFNEINNTNHPSFIERCNKNLSLINPKWLFISNKKLENIKKILDTYYGDSVELFSKKEIDKMKMYVESNCHPESKMRINPLFTRSGFVLGGIPIVFGMLYFHYPQWQIWLAKNKKQTFMFVTLPIVFFQWLNQTQNALFNFSNRSNALKVSTPTFVTSYTFATFSAISVAIGLESLQKHRHISKPVHIISLTKFIPFIAVAIANVVNLLCMRFSELQLGIKISTKDNQYICHSTKAAQKALIETGFTRVVLPIPILVLPPFITDYLIRRYSLYFRRHPSFVLVIQGVAVSLCFALALPFAISIFPQTSKILYVDLEPKARQSVERFYSNANQLHVAQPLDAYVYYNKGL